MANGVRSIAISATPNHSGAKVAIETGGSGLGPEAGTWVVDADGMIDLSVSTNNVRIEVTAENGVVVRHYFLAITRAEAGASDNADLMTIPAGDGNNAAPGLAIDPGTLSPGFDKDVTSYTTLVPSTADDLTVTTRAVSGATVSVTSDKDSNVEDNDDGNPVVELSAGVNVITIMVTAADLVTTKTYTLTLTKAAANASDDAKLSALMVGGESVSVSDKGTLRSNTTTRPEVEDYTTGVANGVSSIAISATPNHSGAKVAIETGGSGLGPEAGTWVVDADGMIDLSINTNNVRIEVTAENGVAVRHYFLAITRAAASASNDAKLSGLTLSGVTLSPAFDPDTKMYSADVPDNIAATTVSATGSTDMDNEATSVVITSERDDSIGKDSSDEAHIASHTIDLSAGANVITIVVTAEDYETTETYTVRVTRGISDDARLSSLSLMTMPAEGTGVAIDLRDVHGVTAAFMADTMMYYASVPNDVEMIKVMAAARDSDATVSGDGAVSLDVGENTITVTVTAADGTTTMTYTVTVTVLAESTQSLLERYDANNSNQIEKGEALTAIDDYLIHGTLTKEEVLDVINLYLFGSA